MVCHSRTWDQISQSVVQRDSCFTYQAGRIAIGNDEIDEDGQMSVVLPQIGQRFEDVIDVRQSLQPIETNEI